MAARKQRWHPDEVRERIRATQLLKRLQDNAFGDLPNELTSGQIKSIEILLRKCLPDLQTVTHKGDADNPVQHVHKVERVIVRPSDPNR